MALQVGRHGSRCGWPSYRQDRRGLEARLHRPARSDRKVGTTLKNGTIFRVIEFAPGLLVDAKSVEVGRKLLSAVG